MSIFTTFLEFKQVDHFLTIIMLKKDDAIFFYFKRGTSKRLDVNFFQNFIWFEFFKIFARNLSFNLIFTMNIKYNLYNKFYMPFSLPSVWCHVFFRFWRLKNWDAIFLDKVSAKIKPKNSRKIFIFKTSFFVLGTNLRDPSSNRKVWRTNVTSQT